MNVLVSPVDALVFDYVSFGIFAVVNNLWTWLAVLAATAVSFWRIRAVKSVSHALKPATPACIDMNVNGSEPVSRSDPSTLASPSLVPPSCTSSSATTHFDGFEDDGVTRGKFVMYYREDDREGQGETAVVGDDGTGYCGECGGGWWESWPEKLLRMRTAEMDWYRYQDLTAINGNVVRLWDGVRVREEYSSVCGVW